MYELNTVHTVIDVNKKAQKRFLPLNPNVDKIEFPDNSKSCGNYISNTMLFCMLNSKEFYLVLFVRIKRDPPVGSE